MQLSYNQATTMENSNLEKDLRYCEQFGYDYIELNIDRKLPEYLETHELKDLKDYFDHYHLKPLALNALKSFNNLSEEDHEQFVEKFKEQLAIAQTLDAKYICLVPLITEDKIHLSEIKKSAVKMLRELSDLAKPSNIKIAVEFIGLPTCTINHLSQMNDILKETDRDNVGMILDVFHFHAMNSSKEALRKTDVKDIFILHMTDAEEYPLGVVRDEDRMWPGEGVIDLEWIVTELNSKGFKGAATVELFRPEYYKMAPDQAIQKAKETTLKVLRDNGVSI